MHATTIASESLTPGEEPGWARVLFFGRVADACGRRVDVPVPPEGCSVRDLKARIATMIEGSAASPGEPAVRVAIDHVIAGADPWVSPAKRWLFYPRSLEAEF